MRQVSCLACKREFTPSHFNTRICSPECKKLQKSLYSQRDYLKRKEIVDQQHKEYYYQNRKPIKTKRRTRYLQNKEKVVVQVKTYRANPVNRKRLLEARASKRKTDVNYAISCRLRARLTNALKRGKCRKTNSTLELIGCSVEFLLAYLESQFSAHPETSEVMSWANRDKWHVDHRRPIASFDLADPEQQKKCFHYTNLQPLWAKDNLEKGSQNS